MKRAILLITTLLLIIAGTPPADAQDAGKKSPLAKPSAAGSVDEVRKAIQEAWDKADKAYTEKDIEGMFALCTPDFVSFSTKGDKTTLAEGIAEYKRMLPMLASIESVTSVETVTVKGTRHQRLSPVGQGRRGDVPTARHWMPSPPTDSVSSG